MRYMHEGSMEIKVGGGLQNITNITAVYLYVEVEHQSQFFLMLFPFPIIFLSFLYNCLCKKPMKVGEKYHVLRLSRSLKTADITRLGCLYKYVSILVP